MLEGEALWAPQWQVVSWAGQGEERGVGGGSGGGGYRWPPAPLVCVPSRLVQPDCSLSEEILWSADVGSGYDCEGGWSTSWLAGWPHKLPA